jgi:hypothetical protein
MSHSLCRSFSYGGRKPQSYYVVGCVVLHKTHALGRDKAAFSTFPASQRGVYSQVVFLSEIVKDVWQDVSRVQLWIPFLLLYM